MNSIATFPTHYDCITATERNEILPHLNDWRLLCQKSSKDNAFYTPEFLLPNLALVKENHAYYLIFIYRKGANYQALVGFGAFLLEKPCIKRPFNALSYIRNEYNFHSAPLFDKSCAEEVEQVLLDYLRDSKHPWHLVALKERHQNTTELLEHGFIFNKKFPFVIRHTSPRAVLTQTGSYTDFEAQIPKKRFKDYRRRLKKLKKEGKVEFDFYREHNNPLEIADKFMRIESASWKGEQGSALSCTVDTQTFFKKIVGAFNSKKQLFVVELKLNGQTIAMSIGLVHGKTLFAFKIAYDPAYRAFSPGILVMMETSRLFYGNPALKLADACNSPDSFVVKYWPQSQSIVEFCIPTRRISSQIYFQLLAIFHKLKIMSIRCRQHCTAFAGNLNPSKS